KIFTGSFQAIRQSPESGVRTEASGMLPNLRQKDNYVECQLCLKSFEYDSAAIAGKRYIQTIRNLQNKQYADA
ncbi:MAG: hypothetical protein AABY38_06635, partial [Planctomycetota bacterium]